MHPAQEGQEHASCLSKMTFSTAGSDRIIDLPSQEGTIQRQRETRHREGGRSEGGRERERERKGASEREKEREKERGRKRQDSFPPRGQGPLGSCCQAGLLRTVAADADSGISPRTKPLRVSADSGNSQPQNKAPAAKGLCPAGLLRTVAADAGGDPCISELWRFPTVFHEEACGEELCGPLCPESRAVDQPALLESSVYKVQTATLPAPLSKTFHFQGEPLWEGYRESRRCSRDTYPESSITKYTRIRRQQCAISSGLVT